MKVINHILETMDYVYCRTFLWYKKHKDSNPRIMAAGVLSVAIFLFALIILIFLSIVFPFSIPDVPKSIVAVIYLCVLGLIVFRYSKISMINLELRWKNEDIIKKKKRGWMIFLFLVGELLFIIISSYIRHNVYGDAEFFK